MESQALQHLKGEVDELIQKNGISRDILERVLKESPHNIPSQKMEGKSLKNLQLHNDTMLEKTFHILQLYYQNITNVSKKMLENVNELIVSGKSYKIRQNFRNLMLNLLNINKFAFYAIHESGRIEFQDFSYNFITQILQTDPKCLDLENIVDSRSQDFFLVDIADNSEYAKIFQINPTKIHRNSYYGFCFNTRLSQEEEDFQICVMISTKKQIQKENVEEDLQRKLLQKIIEIAMISPSQQCINTICKMYSKKMLDLLQILLLNSRKKWLNRLLDLYSINRDDYSGVNLKNLIKVILSKKITQGKSTLIKQINNMSTLVQEDQFNQIQEIRMYKKYVRDCGIILLEFDYNGKLRFISGRKDHVILNNLSTIWEENKPVLEELFQFNPQLLEKLKKCLHNSMKSNRAFVVMDDVTVKIIKENKKILKLHMMINNIVEESSRSNSLFQSRGTVERHLKKPKQKKKQPLLTMKMIEKQNPGISEEGWLDLFIKNSGNGKKKRQNWKMKTYQQNSQTQILDKEIWKSSSFSIGFTHSVMLDGIDITMDNVNMLNFDHQELQSVVLEVFKKIPDFKPVVESNTKLRMFHNFLSDIHDQYQAHSNPFHNFIHGVNVMHMCYLISSLPENQKIFTNHEIFAIVFSGLCHDVGHTGFTNSFQIASQSKKALLFNDRSPLENFHASTTFQLLKKQKNNFLNGMNQKDFLAFRKLVISNILFTDIKEHFPLLKKFQKCTEDFFKNQENTQTLSNIIVHSSDFAGSIKDFKMCEEWSYRVNKEFTKQYRVEKQLGLPQTPFMKDLQNKSILAKNQGGFLKVIVFPLFQALGKFYNKNLMIQKFQKNIETNIRSWEERQKQEKQD